MASSICNSYQERINTLSNTTIPNATNNFNAKKASAQGWIDSLNKDFLPCMNNNPVPNIDSFLNSGTTINLNVCIRPYYAVFRDCSKEGCESRIRNSVNPAIVAALDAKKSMNDAIALLETEKKNYANDQTCKDVAIQLSETTSQLALKAKDTLSRNLTISLIAVVAIIIIVILIRAFR